VAARAHPASAGGPRRLVNAANLYGLASFPRKRESRRRRHSFCVERVIWSITQDTPPWPSSTTFDHNSQTGEVACRSCRADNLHLSWVHSSCALQNLQQQCNASVDRGESTAMSTESTEQPYWYAIQTRSRHEKVGRNQLAVKQITHLLPLWRKRSVWKDRMKWADTFAGFDHLPVAHPYPGALPAYVACCVSAWHRSAPLRGDTPPPCGL